MRVLPREHGATVIWLSASILALATLPLPPQPQLLTTFLTASLIILVALGRLTNSSSTILRMERNRIILPLTSGGLTVIAPLGYFIMAGEMTLKITAIWLLLLTYTVVSVAYTQEAVQAILQRRAPLLSRYLLPGSLIFVVEALLLSLLGWLHPAVLTTFTPLLAIWILQRGSAPSENTSKLKAIRKTGFQQTGNMLAFAAIIAIISRL